MRKVCIVGAGASGMAVAWSLRRATGLSVTVYEASDRVGGVATTVPLDRDGHTFWLNNRVQAGSPAFHNARRFFEAFGADFEAVAMKVSIGTGQSNWNNSVATPFIKGAQREIGRLRSALAFARKVPFLFMFVPIGVFLKLWRFSERFQREVMEPLVALFFAAGSEAMKVPTTAVAQLVFDADAKVFDFGGDTLLSKSPVMSVFPHLGDFYEKVAAASGASIRLKTRVASIIRQAERVTVVDEHGGRADFDVLVMACPAHLSLQLLDKPSRLERLVLGRIRRIPSKVVIHTDKEFVRRHYEPADGVQYMVRRDPSGGEARIEITCHMNSYQHQLKSCHADIYYTIDPVDEVDPALVLETLDVEGTALTCRHFTSVVPLWRLIQGRNRTWHCGGDTMVNIHELAIVSGLAVAAKLGAPYPFDEDVKAKELFDMYCKVVLG